MALAVVLAVVRSVVEGVLPVVDVDVEEEEDDDEEEEDDDDEADDVVVVDDEEPPDKKGAACALFALKLAAPSLLLGQPVAMHASWEQHPRNGGDESRQTYHWYPVSRQFCPRI